MLKEFNGQAPPPSDGTGEVMPDPRIRILQSEMTDPALRDAAFSSIVQDFEGPLRRQATHMVGPDRAEDVVQDAFLGAFLAIGRFETRDDDSLAKWLHTIVRNTALNVIHSESIRPKITWNENVEKHAMNRHTSHGDPVARQEFKDTLAVLEEINPRQLDALMLAASGVSYNEIARRHGGSLPVA